MNPITIPNISIPTIGIPTIGIPSVGFPSASGGGGLSWPAGMKEHIKAWYDPKKQGMTNFDVIESYITDFTTWRTADKNYVGLTIRSSSFSISFNKVSNHVIMWKPNYLFNEEGQVKLQVSRITDNISIIIKHGTQEFPIVNGVNTFSFTQEENKSLSFVCKNVFQDTNITITQLPTSILKDLSGNGNHAYLYGGKGKLNSGMGLYKVDFTSWRKSSVQTEVKPDVVKVTPNTSNYLFVQYDTIEIPSYKIKVIGLGDNVLTYQYAAENGRKEINIVEGENELPTSIKGSAAYQVGYKLTTPGTSVFTITQIPDYPDQLCYDGKMHAVCYGFPILTDYTVMAERAILDNSDIADWAFIAKRDYPAINGAFTFEKDIYDTSDNLRTISFGRTSVIYNPIKERSISYQTKNKYNGQDIIVGNVDDVDFLLIGAGILDTNLNLVKEKMRVAHGAIIVADRSFTEEEINWLKQNWDKI
jgi:hypothetical protein